MKRSKSFFKLVEKDNGDVFWNKILSKPLGEKRNSNNDQEYDIDPNIQAYFTNRRLTTKNICNEDKLIPFTLLENIGFYDNIPKKGFNSAGRKDALYKLPKAITITGNSLLPTIDDDVSDDFEGQGKKIIISHRRII